MNADALALIALEPLPTGNWLQEVQRAYASLGFATVVQRSGLLVWEDQKRMGSITFSDGWQVERLWLGPKRWALSYRARRLYFQQDTSQLDLRQEHLITSGNKPSSAPASEQIASQWTLLSKLKTHLDTVDLHPVQLEPVVLEPTAASIAIGSVTYLRDSLNERYKSQGFDHVPADFAISICPLERVVHKTAEDFKRRIEQAATQRHTDVVVRITAEQTIQDRLQELKQTGEDVAQGRCVLFILPQKAGKPTPATIALWKRLEAAGVPFRRAYADDPLAYSIPDQFPSLLMAAGGRPHAAGLKIRDRPIWTIGVDLGHPHQTNRSVLALTLVDPEGALSGAWVKEQPRDETARPATIGALLAQCQKRLYGLETHPSVVVIRDGRLFEHERVETYSQHLGDELSLLEYRKRGNPQMVRNDGTPRPLQTATAATVPGLNTLFLLMPPRNPKMLPYVTKVSWKKPWNKLQLSATEIAHLLVRSAAAPGLGLHPRHLPAPVYWADGIAGANDEDLRFRGLPVEYL